MCGFGGDFLQSGYELIVLNLGRLICGENCAREWAALLGTRF